MQITGNTILITGGTSGIGFSFAEEFHRLGNEVIICGRRKERLQAIAGKYPEIITRQCDVANSDERKNLAEWVKENYPALNVFINNAGIQLKTDLTHPADDDKMRSEVETNLIAPIHLASLFSEHLITKKEAAIINISSGLAFTPKADYAVYCATKAAIHSFTLSLRYQLKKTSVRVFEIAPPSVDTELGYQHREDPNSSHGGIPVHEFLKEAMEGIKNDELEIMVGMAKKLRTASEEMFKMLNP